MRLGKSLRSRFERVRLTMDWPGENGVFKGLRAPLRFMSIFSDFVYDHLKEQEREQEAQ